MASGAAASGADALITHLAACGYPRCEPPLLQPAAVFLDQSGEDIRGRLYLTSDPSGAELCLRPEFTIPVCRAYLASSDAGRPAFFSYLGPVFRYRPNGPAQAIQAGLENFGRDDREAADADVLACALEAAEAAGAGPLAVRIGDAGLIRAFLDALALPPIWARRIAQGLGHGRSLGDILAAATAVGRNGDDHSGVLAALDGVDTVGARALVEDLLSIAGITTVGGRSAGEIAERFLEQAALRGGPGVPAEKRTTLERFLALSGDPDTVAGELRRLASDAALPLDEALDAFDQRLHFLAARGVDLTRTTYAAGFARRLDYYTGFVFEAFLQDAPGGPPLIGGGRYDRLLRSLGGNADMPAVGAAIFLDRLPAAAGAQA